MDGQQGRVRRGVFVLGLVIVCGISGCVERRYTIRTEPPGALVVVNDQELGLTPVSAPFTFYGDREIMLMKDGFQTQRVIQPIPAPWWDNLATEFFTENLIPVNFRDERDYSYRMTPAIIPATNDLLQRGVSLRGEGQTTPPARRGGFFGFFGF